MSLLVNPVAQGLAHTYGSYRMLARLFNMAPEDDTRFLNFLRKHQRHIPSQPFRGAARRVAAPNVIRAVG